jgi:AcrR family transcriptional regulator
MTNVRRGPSVREHLIATAARILAEGGGATASVRDIARAARLADGVLYNHFEDKDDLLAHGLLAHVGGVMHDAPAFATAGTATVVDNLAAFIDGGLAVLGRVLPAFAGLLAQPGVLRRFHAMVGGDRAFTGDAAADQPAERGGGGESLPALLTSYLRAERDLGRVAAAADLEAVSALVVGAIHGIVLPPLLLGTDRTPPAPPSGLTRRLAEAVVSGIAP